VPAFAPQFTITHAMTGALTAIDRAHEAKGLIRHEGETNRLVYLPGEKL